MFCPDSILGLGVLDLVKDPEALVSVCGSQGLSLKAVIIFSGGYHEKGFIAVDDDSEFHLLQL